VTNLNSHYIIESSNLIYDMLGKELQIKIQLLLIHLEAFKMWWFNIDLFANDHFFKCMHTSINIHELESI